MHLLQNIHCEFYGDGILSIDTTEGKLLGGPYGGLAVLWQKSLNTFVKVIRLEDETRLMGFDINFGIILELSCKYPGHMITSKLGDNEVIKRQI